MSLVAMLLAACPQTEKLDEYSLTIVAWGPLGAKESDRLPEDVRAMGAPAAGAPGSRTFVPTIRLCRLGLEGGPSACEELKIKYPGAGDKTNPRLVERTLRKHLDEHELGESFVAPTAVGKNFDEELQHFLATFPANREVVYMRDDGFHATLGGNSEETALRPRDLLPLIHDRLVEGVVPFIVVVGAPLPAPPPPPPRPPAADPPREPGDPVAPGDAVCLENHGRGCPEPQPVPGVCLDADVLRTVRHIHFACPGGQCNLGEFQDAHPTDKDVLLTAMGEPTLKPVHIFFPASVSDVRLSYDWDALRRQQLLRSLQMSNDEACNAVVYILGQASRSGDFAVNRQLSLDRMKSVWNFLLESRVNCKTVRGGFFGSTGLQLTPVVAGDKLGLQPQDYRGDEYVLNQSVHVFVFPCCSRLVDDPATH